MEVVIKDISFVAAEDLSSYQYHFVVLNSDGKVRLPDSTSETPIGVLQNAPTSGEVGLVRTMGISKVVAKEAIDEGALVSYEYVGATDAGKADSVTTGTILGICTRAAGAEDDLAYVLLNTYHIPTP